MSALDYSVAVINLLFAPFSVGDAPTAIVLADSRRTIWRCKLQDAFLLIRRLSLRRDLPTGASVRSGELMSAVLLSASLF